MGASASSGSSPSSLTTSPKRWAAKPDQLQDLQDSEPCIFPAVGGAASCPRSCSADHLGAIVDILGVPNGAPQFWENPRRLILSAEKRKVEMKRSVLCCELCRDLLPGHFLHIEFHYDKPGWSRLVFRCKKM